MSGPVTGTPLPWVGDDGGRSSAGYEGITDKDCVTRSIAIGTGLPYSKLHDMVDAAGKKYGATAETGVDGSVTAEILLGRGWRLYPFTNNARLTLEDLLLPLTQHSALCVETERYPAPDEGVITAGYHLTAVINGEVHDLPGAATNGYARPDLVKNVFGRPM